MNYQGRNIQPRRFALLILAVNLLIVPSDIHMSLGSDSSSDFLRMPIILEKGFRSYPQTTTSNLLGTDYGVDFSECPPMLEFDITQVWIGSAFDNSVGATRVFAGDFENDRIMEYVIDSALNVTSIPVPLAYGLVWLVEDLDQDGELELVVQRGDFGFGGNGYLDIHSVSDWRLRERFTFPDMKVGMNPVAVDIDGDSTLELYVTPHGFEAPARAVIIKYSPTTDNFVIINEIIPPIALRGPPAVGDFDSDGRMEFISGIDFGYSLIEWQDSTLAYIGVITDSTGGNNFHATSCRPRPGDTLHALLGHSSPDYLNGFRYQLYKPIGDNVFTLVHTFQQFTGWAGASPSSALDFDCDGLDELLMIFAPMVEIWEWDTLISDFTVGCTWNNASLQSWYEMDLDRNKSSEFISVSGALTFRSFPALNCVDCDTTGICPHDPECACLCHADPLCDQVTDVFDVLGAVAVGFQNGAPVIDGQCPKERTDVTCDGFTDVFDVLAFVSVAFQNADPAVEFCDPCGP